LANLNRTGYLDSEGAGVLFPALFHFFMGHILLKSVGV